MTNQSSHRAHGHRERLRQQFSLLGGDIGDVKLLELFLTYAIPRRDVAPIADALLVQFGSLEMVFSAPLAELTQIEGIGESAVTLIKLVQYLRTVESTMVISRGDSQQMSLFVPPEKAEEQPVKIYANDEIANAIK